MLTETTCTAFSPEVTPVPGLIQNIESEEVAVVRQLISPDGTRALIIAQTTDPFPSLPKLGQREQMPEYTIFQGWIVRTDGSDLQPIFYTVEDFGFQWTPDSHHLVVAGTICYGDNPPEYVTALGLFAIDVDTSLIYTIDPEYITGCEGSLGYQIAPDAQHLIYEPGIVATMDGTVQVRVCGEQEWARSYAWSQGGRYAYVSCFASYEETDTLRRFDTWTGETLVLVDRSRIGFKAIEMAMSPDQTHLAFIWGTSNFMPAEPYGVWIIDLTKLKDHQ